MASHVEDLIDVCEGIDEQRRRGAQPEPTHQRLARLEADTAVRRGLGPDLLQVDGFRAAVDDEVVDAILDERVRIRPSEQPLVVRFVVRKENRHVGVDIQVEPAQFRVNGRNRPRSKPARTSRSWGFEASAYVLQVFRNQIVGRMWSAAALGPRFVAVILMTMSSGDAFAYSTSTSKYLLPSNTPVSSSSYSKSVRERRRLVSTRSAYG